MEFNVEDDEKDTQKTAPDTYFQELTRIGHYCGREQKRPGYVYKTLAQGHVFEDGPIGESIELFE